MSEIILVPPGESFELKPEDPVFAHGLGLFETMKLEGGKLCFWSAHWTRLSGSACRLGLDCPFSSDDVLVQWRRFIEMTCLRDGILKLSLVRAPDGARLFLYARQAHPWPESLQVQLREDVPVNERSLLAGHKTHNYMETLLLFQQVRAAGYDEAVRLNSAGALAEATMANLFFYHGGRLCTPSLECGLLPGVVRAEVMQLAEVNEGIFLPEALMEAEAAFLTNSAIGLRPVRALGGRTLPWGPEVSGSFEALRSAFEAHEQRTGIQLA
ncbi:aminotransferase class IV [Coraliomargarita parva]|uniref:aminotransferase class IV n=1 Tax=Coraliomargarita parva TaxID=3014050 RepID=UPI0022B3BCD7|nr:aminotransferase class IV [Coraliomargarita parva]